MKEDYIPKARPASIKYTSRASVKIKDCYYTVEACEERVIPDIEDIDIYEERKALWDTVNTECDAQIQEIYELLKSKK